VVEIVRTSFRSDARLQTRRSLDERLSVRWPGVYTALARAFLHLPPRSRLRRALLRRQVLSGWAAWTRGDLDLMLVRYAPDYHFEPQREMVTAGMRSVYRGHAGFREAAADLRDAWERADLTPLELFDAGDVFVVLGHFQPRGGGSGIELDSPFGGVYSVERGLVVRERLFFDWDEALRAAGISTAIDSGRPKRVTSPL
jgi:ketosteroid isomerase-like protein